MSYTYIQLHWVSTEATIQIGDKEVKEEVIMEVKEMVMLQIGLQDNGDLQWNNMGLPNTLPT
mgnify:CR=1 FL=1